MQCYQENGSKCSHFILIQGGTEMFLIALMRPQRTLQFMRVGKALIICVIFFNPHLGCDSVRALGTHTLMITPYYAAENDEVNN